MNYSMLTKLFLLLLYIFVKGCVLLNIKDA